MDKCPWYKYAIQKQPNRSLNGRGAKTISISLLWAGQAGGKKGELRRRRASARMLVLGRHRTCAGLSRKWSAIMGNR